MNINNNNSNNNININHTIDILNILAQGLSKQSMPSSTLYVVATPIGNRADMTVRSVAIFQHADSVAAEDTRVAGQLLHYLGLHKPLIACDAHREESVIHHIIERLSKGERVVLCSDAGTPAISDPGARLVSAVRLAGFRVIPIAGASSVSTAISASGLVGATEGGFMFHAFAPNKGKAQQAFYEQFSQPSYQTMPHVWFEAPHRIEDALKLLAQLMPERLLCIARELTKQFEEIITVPCSQAPQWLSEKPERQKGEFVLVLGSVINQTTVIDCNPLNDDAYRLAKHLSSDLPASKAAGLAASYYKVNRSDVYTALMAGK